MIKSAVKTKRKPSPFKSIFRTAEILGCLNKGITTVSEISKTLKINKSTVYRLLQALGETGITIRNPINRRYYIGKLIAELAANPSITHQTLVLCSISEMERLSKLTGESIAVNVLIGINTYLLHEIPSTQEIQIVARSRISANLHAGGTSKVLLAQLPAKELKIVMNNLSFERLTDRTVTSKEELMAQLKEIRKQEYVIGTGERAHGAMSISVPIKNYILPACLGILGLEDRIKPRTAEYVDALLESGARVRYNLSRLSKNGTFA
ncbi:MAG: IclR family transcriptional regulator [Dehalococcoidales bacterium]|jgi:DNA-binding IclR family transcriptional regulator